MWNCKQISIKWGKSSKNMKNNLASLRICIESLIYILKESLESSNFWRPRCLSRSYWWWRCHSWVAFHALAHRSFHVIVGFADLSLRRTAIESSSKRVIHRHRLLLTNSRWPQSLCKFLFFRVCSLQFLNDLALHFLKLFYFVLIGFWFLLRKVKLLLVSGIEILFVTSLRKDAVLTRTSRFLEH